MPDDHSEVVPLLPIPNRTVKRLCADDSAGSRVKVGHRQAVIPKGLRLRDGGLFSLPHPSMLARIQQSIVLTIAFAGLAAAIVGAQSGRAWFGAAVVAIAITGYLSAIAFEFWLLHRSYAADDPERPSVRELARAWATEVLVAPRVFLWNQPFRSARHPDHLPAQARGRLGVVLVHGFFCNRGLWNPWLHRFRAADIPFVAVNLEPVLGSIDDYGETIAAAVAAIESATGRP